MKRPYKRPPIFLSQARAFWRLSRKAQIAGNRQQQDWYAYQAQMAYNRYLKGKQCKTI
jgi:hypothetical protein